MHISAQLHYQDVQERCRREVMEVLGDEKAAVADMPKMPYVLATIAEVPFSDVEKIASSCSDMLQALTSQKCLLF